MIQIFSLKREAPSALKIKSTLNKETVATSPLPQIENALLLGGECFAHTKNSEWPAPEVRQIKSYDSSTHRASFLPNFPHDYNYHRPHAALHHLPPASRLPKTADNLLRYDS